MPAFLFCMSGIRQNGRVCDAVVGQSGDGEVKPATLNRSVFSET
jgi:hypothetical protein